MGTLVETHMGSMRVPYGIMNPSWARSPRGVAGRESIHQHFSDSHYNLFNSVGLLKGIFKKIYLANGKNRVSQKLIYFLHIQKYRVYIKPNDSLG